MAAQTLRAPRSLAEVKALPSGQSDKRILSRHNVQESSTSQQNTSGGFLSGFGDILTVENVSVLLGLSQSTVRGLLNRGGLPGVKLGRRWYVPRVHLAERLGVVD